MKVRLLHSNDAYAYQTLRLLALKESPTSFSASYEDEVGRSMEDAGTHIVPAADGSICMLGAFEHDKLAGFLAIVHPQRAKLRHCFDLAGMYVSPDLRRHGFGSALLKEAIARAQSIVGVRQIKLGVNVTNVAAKALYKSLGFESWGVEPDALRVDGTFYGEEHYVLRISSAT